jgi:hypothetical protein
MDESFSLYNSFHYTFCRNQPGKNFKITNANTTSYTSTELSPAAAGTISDIEFGANENEILLTLSNYNQTSIFYSTNGGTSWQNKEGNLPDMPVRTILRNPDDLMKYW